MAFTDNSTGGRVMRQGLLPYKLTLTDTCNVGDLIGFDGISAGTWERAKANTKVYAQFVAGEPCPTSGNVIVVYREAIISGFTGAVVGDPVYLADTAGVYEDKPDGNYVQCVGVCISATEAVIRPDSIPTMSYSVQTDATGLGPAGFFRSEIVSGIAGPMFGGVKIECKINDTADTPGRARGLYILHQINKATTSRSDNTIVRLEDAGTQYPGQFIEFACGNAVGPEYLFRMPATEARGFSATLGTCSTGDGWLKIQMGSLTRYINLYNDTPA